MQLEDLLLDKEDCWVSDYSLVDNVKAHLVTASAFCYKPWKCNGQWGGIFYCSLHFAAQG